MSLHVMHVLEATEGGTARWLQNVLLHGNSRGVRHSAVVSLRRGPAFAHLLGPLREAGVDVHLVDMRRPVSPWHDAAAIHKLCALIAKERPFILHLHSSKAGMLGRIAAGLLPATTRPRVFYTPHAFAFLAPGPIRPLYRALEAAARRFTGQLMAVSPSEAQLARGLGYPPQHIAVVPNGVQVHTFDASYPPTGPVQITAIGRLCPQKNPLLFLRACRLLHEEHNDWRFLWVGGGAMLSRCTNYITKNKLCSVIQMMPTNPHIWHILESASIFVSTSRYEGMSYALLEAMAAKRPVVATDVPGTRDVIEDGVSGVLVPPDAPQALAEALSGLGSNAAKARALGRCAASVVQEKYTLERQLRELNALYHKEADTPPQRS